MFSFLDPMGTECLGWNGRRVSMFPTSPITEGAAAEGLKTEWESGDARHGERQPRSKQGGKGKQLCLRNRGSVKMI